MNGLMVEEVIAWTRASRKLDLRAVGTVRVAERDMCRGKGAERRLCRRVWTGFDGALVGLVAVVRRSVRREVSAGEGNPRRLSR